MAQKSLPILNKVNTSMTWYTTYYFKHYKWLASQNLYLLYFFNKLFVYLDFLFCKFFWVEFYDTQLYGYKPKGKLPKFLKERFFKPVTSYLVNIHTKVIFFNLYYKPNFEHFQSFDKVEEVIITNFKTDLIEFQRMSRLAYYR